MPPPEPPALTADQLTLLHTLGFMHLRGNQPRRAVALLACAERADPGGHVGIAATLAQALLELGAGPAALGVLDRLIAARPLDPGSPVFRLRARALWVAGRHEEARAAFAAYAAARPTPADGDAQGGAPTGDAAAAPGHRAGIA